MRMCALGGAAGWTGMLALAGSVSAAGGADAFRADGIYDASVPSPAQVLGFETGARAARHPEIVRYAEALAAAGRNVRLERYASTHEGRPLVLLTISSEANLARLDSIRQAIAQVADPRRPEGTRLVETTPAVAYFAYSIHGDELSGSDASLRVAYELAAGETADVKKIRDELVVLLDLCENPDGRERFLSMTSSFQGAVGNPDPDTLSHAGFWPWGRANHYLFDLNRDWFALVHPESRGRAAILKNWRPQVVVDAHEMGSESTFLFSPPRAPFNPHLPAMTRPWWERFAADQARAFDARGWSYYTGEWNEEFFPGYGSALALYQGAVGILYEQASSDGQPIRRSTGAVLEYKEAVAHQFVSSLANLSTAAGRRAELLRAYRGARAEAIERGKKGIPKAYYFSPRPEAARAARLASSLAAVGIEVERTSAGGTLPAARSFWEDGARAVALPEGTFRVRLDQPDGLLARAVLDPHSSMPESFLAEEREHLERQKGTRLYDTTAWSPLLLSGVEAYWSQVADPLAWAAVGSATAPPGRAPAAAPRYGWIFDGSADGALALAARLASRGRKVRCGEKPFELSGRKYPRGSFLLRVEENPRDTGDLLRELAPAAGVEVVSADTGRPEKGSSLGGDEFRLLEPARIAIASGPPLDFTSVGFAWNLLDSELSMRVSLVELSRMRSAGLSRYNVIVLPNAWEGARAYRRTLTDEGIAAVKAWIEAGGTLVCLAGGAQFASDEESKLSKVRQRGQALRDFGAPLFGLDEDSIRSVERMQAMGIGADRKAPAAAGAYAEDRWPGALGIPGAGSPAIGPGLFSFLGPEGEAARKRGSLLAASPTPAAKDKEKKDEAKPARSDAEEEARRKKADDRLRRFLPSGALLRVDLDEEHWLAYGAGSRVAAIIRGRDALLARDPIVSVGRFAAPDLLHLGGLLWPEAAGRIAHTAFATREAMGSGQIVLFSEDPNFRGYSHATARLFLNAVLLGPGLGSTRPVPW